MAYSYESLSTYVDDAAREAAFADYTQKDGWRYDESDQSVTKTQNFGESSSSDLIYLDGRAYTGGYSNGATDPYTENSSLAAEYAGAISAWRVKIDGALSGWDDIPDPSVLDGIEKSCLDGVKRVAGSAGAGGATFQNADLKALQWIEKYLPSPEESGKTVVAFYTNYGPPTISVVLDGQCEAIAALGLGVTGTKKLFEKSRADVANLVGMLPGAFKQTRQHKSVADEFKTVLTITGATLDLIGVFAGPAAPAIGGLSTGTSFLSAALDLLPKAPTKTEQYTGSSPSDVFADLETAIKTLKEKAQEQDSGLTDVLNSMKSAVDTAENQVNFHVHPKKGVADLGDDIIDMKYPHLEQIGYDWMPLIAKAFYDAAHCVEDANKTGPWIRPGVVGLGSYGSYFAWQALAYRLIPLLMDNGSEIVVAGENLAKAAGWMQDADGGVKKTIGKDYEHIQNAELGWVPPPAPPSPSRRHGGPLME